MNKDKESVADRGAGNPAPQTPTLFAWVASAMTVTLVIVTQFLPRGSNSALRGVGVPLLFVAGVLIFWPFHLLAKHGGIGQTQPYTKTTAVVDRGLYAIIRHPQYLGYMLLACGFALLSQHWVTGLLAALGITCFYLQAMREEAICRARLGEPYAHYCERVPRFNAVVGIARLVQGGGK